MNKLIKLENYGPTFKFYPTAVHSIEIYRNTQELFEIWLFLFTMLNAVIFLGPRTLSCIHLYCLALFYFSTQNLWICFDTHFSFKIFFNLSFEYPSSFLPLSLSVFLYLINIPGSLWFLYSTCKWWIWFYDLTSCVWTIHTHIPILFFS